MKLARLITSLLLLLCIGGCAVAQSPSGRYVLGVGIASEPGSVAQAADAAGGILGALGVPGAGLIGDGLGVVLTALGFGVAGKQYARAKASEAKRDGENTGWSDALMTYGAPPPSTLPASRAEPAPGPTGNVAA